MTNNEKALESLQSDKEDDSSLFTLSGLLAGFSITGVVAFLDKTRDDTLMVALFLLCMLSSFLFILATIILMLILESINALQDCIRSGIGAEEIPGGFKYRGFPRIFCYITFSAGLICILFVLGLAGFVHSWLVGLLSIVATIGVIAAVFLCVDSLQFGGRLQKLRKGNAGGVN